MKEQNLKNNKTKRLAIIGLIAVLVMALGAVAVFAQDDVPDVTPGEVPGDSPTWPGRPFGRGGHYGGFHGGFHDRSGRDGANDEALAEALGITVEELDAARQKAAADRLAQAVEAGALTQDQANTMLAMMALKGYLDQQAIMAQALGLSVEELQAARDDGTLHDLLADMTPAELQEKMQTAVTAAIQRAVTDNAITQSQADLVLESLQNGFGMGNNLSGPHHFGHGHDHFRGVPDESVNQGGEAFAPMRRLQGAPAANF